MHMIRPMKTTTTPYLNDATRYAIQPQWFGYRSQLQAFITGNTAYAKRVHNKTSTLTESLTLILERALVAVSAWSPTP